MPKKVMSASGMPVTVATIDDIEGGEYTLPPAAPGVLGGVTQGEAVPDSVATDVATLTADFNALVTVLRGTGILP